MIRRPPRSPLFPYPTLFRSHSAGARRDSVVALFWPELDTAHARGRSEEHTSELQSRLHLVCRLLLEKKNFDDANDVCAARRLPCLRHGHLHPETSHTVTPFP